MFGPCRLKSPQNATRRYGADVPMLESVVWIAHWKTSRHMLNKSNTNDADKSRTLHYKT
jgi:hypothetical protein